MQSTTEYADLHAHTTASDGATPPADLVRLARDVGLTYLAVTDHDTTAGLAEAASAARRLSIRLIAGVELSAEGAPGKCHLLGLGIDPAHEGLNHALRDLSASRRARNLRMAERLRSLGAPITLDEVVEIAPPGANIGRPHFAQALLARGYVRDIPQAFSRYLADDAAAYVTKETLAPAQAIELVHAAGGLCFIAHPGLLRLSEHENLETRFQALKEVGIDGIEAYYSAYSPALTARLLRIAEKLALLVTGGSDFHGANKPDVPLGIVVDGHRLPSASLPPALLGRALPCP